MQGGEPGDIPEADLPAPLASPAAPFPSTASPSSTSMPPPPPPPPSPEREPADSSPALPTGSPDDPPGLETATGSLPKAGTSTWYRSDHARFRSVHRRANPWYRRLGRGLVLLTAMAALGTGLYFGARQLQDYLDRHRLPGPGVEVPEIRTTIFQIRSSEPAPEVDGTLTIDAASRAFEFVGRIGGSHSGIEVVSPDGSTTYIRTSQDEWALLTDSLGDRLDRQDLLLVVRYLSNDKNSDAILTNRLRRGYVDLVEQAVEGLGDDRLTRYELELNTLKFGTDYPLQWQDFQNDAIPGAQKVSALAVIIWLDTDDVLVRVRDEQTHWSWERLSYSDIPFTPIDPASTLLEETTDSVTEASEDPEAADEMTDG